MLKLINITKQISFTKAVLCKDTPAAFNRALRHYSNFGASPVVREIDKYPQVEIIKNAPEWQYVELLLRPKFVPEPKAKSEYPSGWTPVVADPSKVKYFINRTKNHMVPVYLKTTFRGERRITLIRRIQGDIWSLESDVKRYIESNVGKVVATRINELCGQLRIHGDHVNLVKEFLKSQGF